MSILNKTVTIDFGNTQDIPEIRIVQGEARARIVHLKLSDGSEAVNLTGCTARIYILPRGETTPLYEDLTITSASTGKCDYEVSGNAASVAGAGKFWIEVLQTGSPDPLSVGYSKEGKLTVIEKQDFTGAIEASTVFSALLSALATAVGLDANAVHKTGNESVAGVKTLTSSPIIPNGATSTAAVNKGQLDLKMNLSGGSGNPFTAMPYVDTAPIVESGSNANGYYVKFADGTMICTKSVTFTNAAVTNATGSLFYSVGQVLGSWAAAFYAAPMTIIDVIKSPDLIWQTTTVAATTTAAPTIVLFSALSTTVTVVANVIAVGRWKA